jgi:CRP-like cAMP-binding protein
VVNSQSGAETVVPSINFAGNRLLATLSPSERALLDPAAEVVSLSRGDILFGMGDDVTAAHFPVPGTMVSLLVDLADGRTMEVATIGKEGAVGGIVSCGRPPAFARAEVQIPGSAIRIDIKALEAAKARSSHVRDVFCRYADALLAQIMQSVACNAAHPLEARLCRWLLTTQDRSGGEELPLTQEYLAEMLGVQRTTVSGVARGLQAQGLISYRRGSVQILRRDRIEERACECYARVEEHFRMVLPESKPQIVLDAS